MAQLGGRSTIIRNGQTMNTGQISTAFLSQCFSFSATFAQMRVWKLTASNEIVIGCHKLIDERADTSISINRNMLKFRHVKKPGICQL